MRQIIKTLVFATPLIALVFSGINPAFSDEYKDNLGNGLKAPAVKYDRSPNISLYHGGPDAYGYYFIDSEDSASNSPVYQWIDISSSGTDMEISGDDQVAYWRAAAKDSENPTSSTPIAPVRIRPKFLVIRLMSGKAGIGSPRGTAPTTATP